jgi:hypothetical protein
MDEHAYAADNGDMLGAAERTRKEIKHDVFHDVL